MDEQEVIAALAKHGFTVTPDGKGGYDVLDNSGQLSPAHYNSLPELIADLPKSGEQAGGQAQVASPQGENLPPGVSILGDFYIYTNPVTGQITRLGSVAQAPKEPALSFKTPQEAEAYIAQTQLEGLEPYWDEGVAAYKLRDVLMPWERYTLPKGYHWDYVDGEWQGALDEPKVRYYAKPELRQDAEGNVYSYAGEGVAPILVRKAAEETVAPPDTAPKGLEAPEFQRDPRSGQWFMRTTPEGAWQPFNEYVPSLNQQMDKALVEGNVSLAQSLKNFRDQPTPAEALRLGMEIAQSPGDWWTYMKMSRGAQPNVEYDVEGQAIPRSLPSLSLGTFGGLTSMPATGGAPALTEPTFEYPKPRPEDVARQAELRKWALNPPSPTNIPQPQPETIPTRAYIQEEDPAGQLTKRYLTDEEIARLKAQGFGNQIQWETETLQPPTLPASGHESEPPIGLSAPSMRERISAYNESLKPPGYKYNPINEQEGYETIYDVPTDPSRRAGYIAPSTSLARSLASPTGANGVTSAFQTPKFLSELSAGRNVGRARQMATMGFPIYPSAQGYGNLTEPEKQILGAEVKTQGGYLPQYMREMTALWPTWNKRGAFMRAPARIGV